jgi:hypothetical protein
MQTFLAYSGFAQSAMILDDLRLRKQQVEAEQILKVLFTNDPKKPGWKNHPAVLQWKDYPDSLQCYLEAISNECIRRGFKGRHPAVSFTNHNPNWLTREDIHASHRSRLLFKGRVDAVCLALKKHLKVRSIVDWLLSNGYPHKNIFKSNDVIRLESYALNNGVIIPPNFYSQFNWAEPDNIPYVWPVQKEKTERI